MAKSTSKSKKSTAKGEKRYFKLGINASSFHDPKSGLNLAGDEVAAIDTKLFKSSKVARQALNAGHLVEVDSDDFEDGNQAPNQEELEKAATSRAKRDAAAKKNEKKATADPKSTTKPNLTNDGSAPSIQGKAKDGSPLGEEDDDDDE